MENNDLIFQNPLTRLGCDTGDIIPSGGFGAVLARAGVGKTSFLVQLGLSALSRRNNTLHISLKDPVDKVKLWYREVFYHLTTAHNLPGAEDLWEGLLTHRVIMTFKLKDFTIVKLKERIMDLTDQAQFSPRMIIIDGLPFDSSLRKPLTDLKTFTKADAMTTWFAVTTHRHEAPGPDNIPGALSDLSDLFDSIIRLQPEGDKIHVHVTKGQSDLPDRPFLSLDPATLLIKEKH